ncbi:hypothetical protein CDEST_15320 [Colletotrichum destructivum]|uniref:Uncharacterized protein n=1 Tax=Colletotrichum destructivum TaxID=34406 RepID=A0AAX4J4L6_9PEZI|nr:hypothetical protein CDEST_15320 [Colletotrichum destructivum]
MRTAFLSLSVILISQIGRASADHHKYCICADTTSGIGNRDRTSSACSNTQSLGNNREFQDVAFDSQTPFQCYSSNNSLDGDTWDRFCKSFSNTHGKCK